MATLGTFDINEEAYRKAFIDTILNAKDEVIEEGTLDKDHLRATAAKDILGNSGISIAHLTTQKEPTLLFRQKTTKNVKNEETGEDKEEMTTIGPLSINESQWRAFEYVVNKFFDNVNKEKK